MSLVFVCPPVILSNHTVAVRECRVAAIRPTENERIYEVEIVDAPPVTIDLKETDDE